HLVVVAGALDHHVVVVKVHDLGAENVLDLEDLGAGLRGGPDLDEDQLAHHGGAVGEIDDIDDVDQLAQLLDAKVQRLVVALEHHGDAGERGILRGRDVEGVDVEAAPGKHAGNARQYAELVLNEDGDRVS